MRRHRVNVNLTVLLEGVVAHLCAHVPEFAHINPRRVLVCLARTRGTRASGAYAKIVPMRFPDGQPFKVVNGQRYALPQIPTPEGDILYLVYCYTPRFFEQPFERRLLTLFHELYHIAPAFDGTIRRVGKGAHGTSRELYNDRLRPLIDTYLAAAPPPELLDVLRTDLKTLAARGTLVGRALPMPRVVPLPM